jgi:hypothetical protein
MSTKARTRPILIAAFAALLVVAGALLWLRERARDTSARPEATTAASEAAADLRSPTDALDAARESLPLLEAPSPTVDVELAQPATAGPRVVVVVQDHEGRPIHGAEVEITARGPLGKWTCDAAGRCTLPIEPWTLSVQLRVSSAGYIPSCEESGMSEEVFVALMRSVAARGRVIAADDGSPCPGARVAVGPTSCEEVPRDVLCDAAGTFELSGLPQDEKLSWSASAEGFATLLHQIEIRDPATEVVLELARGRMLDIQVVDAQTGAAIEGARIRSEPAAEVRTNVQGRGSTAALFPVGEDEKLLSTFAPKYCSMWTVIHASDIDRGEPLRFPLLLGAELEGTVVDPEGKALAGVEVRLSVDHAGQRADPHHEPGLGLVELPEGWRLQGTRDATVTSDETGRFRFEGLEPESPWYRLRLRLDGIVLVNRKEVPALGSPGTTTRLRLVVEPAATSVITGRMTLNGAPARGHVRWRGRTRVGRDRVDLNGDYRLEGVELGFVDLVPEPDGVMAYSECDLFSRRWTVEAQAGGEMRQDLDLALELDTIAGRVVDASGAPQSGFGVRVMSVEACWNLQGPAKADGTFEFDVRPGPWSYVVQSGTLPSQARLEGVLAGTRDLVLTLPGSGLLRLRVVDARTRAALSAFALMLLDEDGKERRFDGRTSTVIAPDPEGWRELPLTPGRWRVFVSSSSGEPTLYLPLDAGTVLVQASGEPQVLEIELERGLELDLQLTQDQQRWSNEVFVVLLEQATVDQASFDRDTLNLGEEYRGIDVIGSRRVKLDGNGRARIRALRPGPYRFVAFPDTIAIEPSEVVVTGAESAPLELRWTPK